MVIVHKEKKKKKEKECTFVKNGSIVSVKAYSVCLIGILSIPSPQALASSYPKLSLAIPSYP